LGEADGISRGNGNGVVISNLTKRRKDEDDEFEHTELIEINPKRDILSYEIPLGALPLKEYKLKAATSLAKKIVDIIEPDFEEKPGFELMRYVLVVKKLERDE
jgi:hypothetical protein